MKLSAISSVNIKTASGHNVYTICYIYKLSKVGPIDTQHYYKDSTNNIGKYIVSIKLTQWLMYLNKSETVQTK